MTETGESRSQADARIEAADQIIHAVMKDRLDSLGERASGAYSYYKYRVDVQVFITDPEIELARRVVELDPDIREIHEIAAGIGTLSVAFAAFGVNACAVEKDARRLEALEAVRAALNGSLPEVGERFSSLHGYFLYDETATAERARSVAIATNIIASLNEEQQASLVAGLGQYRYAIIDIQRFVKRRESEEEYDRLFAMLADAGLTERALVLDKGSGGLYYALSRNPVSIVDGRLVLGHRTATSTPHAPAHARAVERERLVREAERWGYFKGSIKSRPDLWRGRRVLDIGMGGGPHCVPFVVGGAAAYIGVDPLIGTDQVRDYRSLTDPSVPRYHAFPWSADEIMHLVPEAVLLPGTVEERAEDVKALRPDFAMMSAVTEHLRDPASVFHTVWEALSPGGVLWFSHCNYYSWTGHHRPPRSVAQYDPTNDAHNAVIDWRHLEPNHSEYNNPNFNRIRLDDLRLLTMKYFEIIEWNLALVAIDRLTSEIRRRHAKYSLEELLSQVVYVTARRRDIPLDTDLSALQLHHPDLEYKSDADYSDEDIERYKLMNMVYLSKNNQIVSHSTNNFAGAELFSRLKTDDRILLTKGEKRLTYTVREVRRDRNGRARLVVNEEHDPRILTESYDQWCATPVRTADDLPR